MTCSVAPAVTSTAPPGRENNGTQVPAQEESTVDGFETTRSTRSMPTKPSTRTTCDETRRRSGCPLSQPVRSRTVVVRVATLGTYTFVTTPKPRTPELSRRPSLASPVVATVTVQPG